MFTCGVVQFGYNTGANYASPGKQTLILKDSVANVTRFSGVSMNSSSSILFDGATLVPKSARTDFLPANNKIPTPTLGAWLSQDSVEDVDPWERVERTPRAVAAFSRRRGRVVREMGLGALLDRHLVSLSNGETRRALLARALLAAPRLLLFDAPYVGLDAASRRILASAVDRTVAGGASAVMLATVRREELPRGLTHILELDAAGRVVRQGPVERSNGRTVAPSDRQTGPSDRSTVGPAPPTRWAASASRARTEAARPPSSPS